MERRNVFSIVLRMKGKLIELLGTSGQVLASPSLVTERGRPDLARDKGPLRIVQEFAKPPLSVQASIVKSGTEGGVFLNLSVFDKEADAFPEGIEMILASHGSKEKRRTDSSGEATFSIEKHGEYDIIMTAKGRQAAVFFITFDHPE